MTTERSLDMPMNYAKAHAIYIRHKLGEIIKSEEILALVKYIGHLEAALLDAKAKSFQPVRRKGITF